jgi:malate synthase
MILKFQKITDDYTTHTLIEPDYQEGDLRITELCTIGTETFVHIPEGVVLPEQSFDIEVTMETIVLTDELKNEISSLSPHVILINARVVEKIRAKYNVNDEFKILRKKIKNKDDIEGASYADHVETCIAWGAAEKEKIGLTE